MKELRPVQVILLGFLITIFAGSILLALADRNTKRAGNALY